MKHRVLREILPHCGCLSSSAVVQITEFFGPTCVRSSEKTILHIEQAAAQFTGTSDQLRCLTARHRAPAGRPPRGV